MWQSVARNTATSLCVAWRRGGARRCGMLQHPASSIQHVIYRHIAMRMRGAEAGGAPFTLSLLCSWTLDISLSPQSVATHAAARRHYFSPAYIELESLGTKRKRKKKEREKVVLFSNIYCRSP